MRWWWVVYANCGKYDEALERRLVISGQIGMDGEGCVVYGVMGRRLNVVAVGLYES